MKNSPALLFVTALALAATLHANPTGGRVTHGNASFEIDGRNLIIHQGSDKAIIHWDDFSVSLDELTRFIQPSSNAAALNRVTGALPSHIDGALQANGKLVLVNPNGILVGPGGRIDTQSFIGSALGLSDADFLGGGDMTFSGSSDASVINLGTINAVGGDIFLFGRNVENRGTLNAPDGTVGLGAGQEILLKQSGDERVFVQPKGSGKSGKGVDNAGTVASATAELKAHGNIYALAVNNTGVVRATGATKKNGRVFLTAPGGEVRNSGTISARNADRSGGSIQVTGDDVTLTSTSKIDASGEFAGGQVNVGGGYRGEDPAIHNAAATTVESGATLTANAATGDAGDIVVWADGTTTFAGTISARALGETGRGGDAEVSGAQHLHYTGSADLRGNGDHYGQLLLDPGTITVGPAGEDGADFILDTDLASQLALANVTLSTSNATGGLGTGETVVFETGTDVTWNTPTELRVNAGRNIVVSPGASITNTDGGIISFFANNQRATNNPTPAPGTFDGIRMRGNLSAGLRVELAGSAGADGGIGVYVNGNVTAGTTSTPPADDSGRDLGIVINGTGGASSLSPGVLLETNSTLNATFGSIVVLGEGGTGTSRTTNSQGVRLHDRARIISDGTGADAARIVINGDGSNSPQGIDNDGIALLGESSIRSVDGQISLAGTGPSDSADHSGGIMIESATVETTGTGGISLGGSASATATVDNGDNEGIRIGWDFTDATGSGNPQPGFLPPRIATDTGQIIIDGTSTTSTGLHIAQPASIDTNAGDVELRGTGISRSNEIIAPAGLAINNDAGRFLFRNHLETPSLTTSEGSHSIEFWGTGANIGSSVTLDNTGGLQFFPSAPDASFSVAGSITNNGPARLAGRIHSEGASITFGDITLGGDTLISNIPAGAALEPEPTISFGRVGGNDPFMFTIDAGPATDIDLPDLNRGIVGILGGRNASLTFGRDVQLGGINILDELTLLSNAPLTQTGPFSANRLSANAFEGITLDNPNNRISNIDRLASNASITLINRGPLNVLGSVGSTGGDILLVNHGGNLVLTPAAQVQSGNDLILSTDQNFINLSQNPVQSAGRTLIYTASVEGVRLGGIAVDATEIGKAFPELPDSPAGNILVAITDGNGTFPEPGGPDTPIRDRIRDGVGERRNDRPRTPETSQGDPPPRVVAILERIRLNSPRGSRHPEEDNPVNQIGAAPRILVAQLDSSGSSDPRPPRALPRPFYGNPFAGALFAAPGSDLPLSPELGPVSFGTGGTVGTTDSSLPKDLLEGLSDEAVEELEDALRNP